MVIVNNGIVPNKVCFIPTNTLTYEYFPMFSTSSGLPNIFPKNFDIDKLKTLKETFSKSFGGCEIFYTGNKKLKVKVNGKAINDFKNFCDKSFDPSTEITISYKIKGGDDEKIVILPDSPIDIISNQPSADIEEKEPRLEVLASVLHKVAHFEKAGEAQTLLSNALQDMSKIDIVKTIDRSLGKDTKITL